MKKLLLTLALIQFIFNNSYSQTYDIQRQTFFTASNYAGNYLGVYDFNADGFDDLLVGGSNDIDMNKTPIYLLVSQGNGTFIDQTSEFINGELVAANPYSINNDFNQDGIMDFAIFDKGHGDRDEIGGFFGEDAQLLLSNPEGKWDISTSLADAHKEANSDFDRSELHIKSGSTADINQDGYPDIYVESGGGSDQLLSHVYYNNGDNTFSIGKMYEEIWEYPFKGPNGFWRQQANTLTDVNNDGFPDLLIGQLNRLNNNDQEGLTSYVMLNNGNGSFLEEGAIPLARADWHEGVTLVLSILPIDLNVDGWMDFIYCQQRGYDTSLPNEEDDGFSGNYMQVFINNRGIEFIDKTTEYMNLTEDILDATSDIYGTNSNVGVAKLIDMNEDGFQDIFITHGPPVDKNNPLIYFNDGSNYFNPASEEVYTSITNGNEWTGENSYPIDLNGDGLLDIVSSDLIGGPDGEYGTGDEYDEIYPVFGVRNYPKVSSISISSDQELVGGLDLIFIPDLGITHFYIEKIHGGKLYTSAQELIVDGGFIDRATVESGFLFSPDLDFQGNAYFYIQGANAASVSNLVGSKFITKIEVACGGPAPPTVAGDFVYCEGDEIAPITIENTEGTIVWYADENLTEVLAEGNSFTPSSTIGTTDYYVTNKLTVCESEATIVSVTVNTAPSITIDASSTSICRGESVTLSGQGGAEYQWDNEVVDGVSFQPQQTLEYQLIGFDQNGCSKSVTVVIEVKDVPDKPVITKIDIPSTSLISSASSGNQWFLNGTLIPGAVDSNYKPTETGTYSVQVTTNGCVSEFSDELEVFEIVLSVGDEFNRTIFWPNPVTTYIQLDRDLKFLKYQIYNTTGQVLISGSLSGKVIDVSYIDKGVYFLLLRDKNEHVVKYRFIKE